MSKHRRKIVRGVILKVSCFFGACGMGVSSSSAANETIVAAVNNGANGPVDQAHRSQQQEQENQTIAAQGQTVRSPQSGNPAVQNTSRTLSLARKHADQQTNPAVWCLIKSKTRQHNSSKEAKQSFWFEARSGSVFTIGRDQGCDLSLEDDRCERLNARIVSQVVNGKQGVYLYPESRMYRLIGMRGKASHSQVLGIGAVIKVGSISLEVTDLCTDENDDFADRFAVEIGRSSGSDEASPRVNKEECGAVSDNNERINSRCESAVDSDGITEKEEEPMQEKPGNTETTNTCQLEDDAMCYICWLKDGEVKPESDAENVEVSLSNEANTNSEQPSLEETGHAKAHGSKQRKKGLQNPLIRNPCGNCSGGSRYVHLQCLLTWIKKSGSGHCSICNGVLPAHFASAPPNIELKIVRHRRGHSWVGTRRFRLSFSEVDKVYIGKRSTADVRLPDRSVGDLHARIKFDREKRQFVLSDNNTPSGTFMQIAGPLELGSRSSVQHSSLSEFKIGRTNLTIKIAAKKSSVLNMIQFPSWPKRSSSQS